MNEMNHLERQLRSWMPRPPSGKLKTRLFTGEAVTESENSWQFSWRHFAPVTGILFLVMVTLSSRNVDPIYFAGSPSESLLAAMALSNQTAASYFTSADSCERNALSRETFESTNASHSSSGAGSFFLFKTNSLMR